MEPNNTNTPTQTSMSSKPKARLSIPAAILIAGLMISGSIYITGRTTGGAGGVAAGTAGAPGAPAVDIKNVAVAGEPFIGQASAKVTIAYYSDYQCPFCKKFEIDTMPALKRDYVDTGKAKIVFKDFVFLGEDSKTAAVFGRAVWELYPEAYFAWREAMYQAQDAEGDQGFGDRPSIEKLTKTIVGIDQAKVSAAVDAKGAAYQKLVDADRAEADKIGVNSTPSFVIGKVLIAGAQPLQAFTDALAKVVK